MNQSVTNALSSKRKLLAEAAAAIIVSRDGRELIHALSHIPQLPKQSHDKSLSLLIVDGSMFQLFNLIGGFGPTRRNHICFRRDFYFVIIILLSVQTATGFAHEVVREVVPSCTLQPM